MLACVERSGTFPSLVFTRFLSAFGRCTRADEIIAFDARNSTREYCSQSLARALKTHSTVAWRRCRAVAIYASRDVDSRGKGERRVVANRRIVETKGSGSRGRYRGKKEEEEEEEEEGPSRVREQARATLSPCDAHKQRYERRETIFRWLSLHA